MYSILLSVVPLLRIWILRLIFLFIVSERGVYYDITGDLIRRVHILEMKNLPGVDYQNDWKMISIQIGSK